MVSAEYGPRSTLERRDVEQISSNSFEVRYSLHDDSRARLSLTFLVVGENSDELLLQCHERSGVRDIRSNPGQFDQHVYDLNILDPLKTAIRDKILLLSEKTLSGDFYPTSRTINALVGCEAAHRLRMSVRLGPMHRGNEDWYPQGR